MSLSQAFASALRRKTVVAALRLIAIQSYYIGILSLLVWLVLFVFWFGFLFSLFKGIKLAGGGGWSALIGRDFKPLKVKSHKLQTSLPLSLGCH